MEVYVEFKPCSQTMYEVNLAGVKTPIRPYGDFESFGNILHFVNGKSDSPYWDITDDYRFVYCLYNGAASLFKVTNISSTPIIYKTSKIKKWNEYTKQINSLIKERNKLLR